MDHERELRLRLPTLRRHLWPVAAGLVLDVYVFWPYQVQGCQIGHDDHSLPARSRSALSASVQALQNAQVVLAEHQHWQSTPSTLVSWLWTQITRSLCLEIRKTKTDCNNFLLEQRLLTAQFRSCLILCPSLEKESIGVVVWTAWA